jgi:hypothetical protein
MSSILDPSTIERIFQGDDNAEIIARPGEPIVNIDAVAARRKVNGYIGREISSMMGGAEAALVYSKGRLVWRVPIVFTTPFDGQLGVIGIVDVDARTNRLLIPSNLEETLQANANALLKDSPHSPES